MNHEPISSLGSCAPPVEDANATCDECGALGALTFDGVKLCLRCYSEKGSCCPEFGKDDLWKDRVSEL
jgi:hypothetical protein